MKRSTKEQAVVLEDHTMVQRHSACSVHRNGLRNPIEKSYAEQFTAPAVSSVLGLIISISDQKDLS